ncbi:hypothetical protein Scep_028237 [Stephania cephalantha]|uniref:Uncharacterized protein n=1 Tax=Stephania cephalantha TaxID=152367 RepID=A0AAP0E9H6_9MAGN
MLILSRTYSPTTASIKDNFGFNDSPPSVTRIMTHFGLQEVTVSKIFIFKDS